ncbi:MAG: ABC transporter ATP-binding protein [Bacteroidales bacterium]|nr:ABC transporter ATP-binding protein [Bacteroidales bacterium]
MIKATDILLGYSPGRAVAGPLSFTYADGECVMLRGRNGSGKTTLMKTIAGLLKPLSGTIEKGGEAILVPTRIPKVKGFTVIDFVRTGMLAEARAFKKLDRMAESRVDDAIQVMKLESLAYKDLSRISDGEFQKACVAAALTRKANVVMLDEPTAFLDVENRAMVLSALQRLAHETATTIIFSTHDIHDGAAYSDSVLAL